ncbi:hypothetical protein F2P81_021793 [Scophthalmus maximus]|uniref:Uncharacterized protein n=1 Tax=Scophthalmus maximus TaxID=52904 RepID=A0A6A4S0E7_SCOMX|nr:hypothetical protein F2P81_021793 [Scophthalmus maximus]
MQEVDDGDNDDSWAKRASFTVDEALEILDPSCRQAEGDGGQESSDSAPSISGSPPGSPIPRLGNAEPRSEATASGSAQLAGHVPALAALIRDLPDIISRAAGRKEIPLPLEPPAPAPSAMVVDMYSNQAVAKSLPRWPHFPQLRSFLSEAGANPGRIRAPVARFVPLTLVGEARDCEFPAVPPLEPSLTAILLPKAMFFGGRRPTNSTIAL